MDLDSGQGGMMRRLTVLLAALTLTACNAAVSEKPLFSARDARGASGLKPGLWAMLENDACDFDAARPPAQWPDCARPTVITARTLSGPEPENEKAPLPYIFAGGAPRILQIRMEAVSDASEAAYVYFAVEPGPGRPVTSARLWMVQCGPPPKGQPTQLTEHPLPGMSIRDKTCYAAQARTIRDAAGPSRAWGDGPIRLVWVHRMARRQAESQSSIAA